MLAIEIISFLSLPVVGIVPHVRLFARPREAAYYGYAAARRRRRRCSSAGAPLMTPRPSCCRSARCRHLRDLEQRGANPLFGHLRYPPCESAARRRDHFALGRGHPPSDSLRISRPRAASHRGRQIEATLRASALTSIFSGSASFSSTSTRNRSPCTRRIRPSLIVFSAIARGRDHDRACSVASLSASSLRSSALP